MTWVEGYPPLENTYISSTQTHKTKLSIYDQWQTQRCIHKCSSGQLLVCICRVYHYPPQSVKSTPRTTIKPLNIVAIKLHGKKHVMIDEVYYLQPIFEYVYHASPRGSPLLLLFFFFNLALVQWWIFI